ncbi:MAG: TonB family protein [Acidobacteria bacterium]|nr:TonB family protein [Acidobacteriota bacterium]
MPVPVYPETARKMRVAGTVVVAVTVDESGRVLEARAASCRRHPPGERRPRCAQGLAGRV